MPKGQYTRKEGVHYGRPKKVVVQQEDKKEGEQNAGQQTTQESNQ